MKENRHNRRLEFDSIIKNLFNEWFEDGEDHSKQVYFQQPNKTHLTYPCIIYNRGETNSIYANNSKYRNKERWTVLVITRDHDCGLPDVLGTLPYSSIEPPYKVDNLYHYPMTIYY